MSTSFLRLLRASAIGICITVAAGAQTITGNIGGTVTDTAGGVLPGATVTATNIDTNVAVSTVTNAAGSYSIRFLQIGEYRITVEAAGFAKNVYGPYHLEIDQIAKVDAKLKVGAVSDTTTVTGDIAPILNTDNSQIDTTFDANTIANIPINGQNFSALMQFMPGAVTTQPAGIAGVASVERNTGSSGQVSVNGNRLQTNNYLWDGVEINETINNLIGYNPSVDSIQEMKVVAANPNAEYGNANGGDVIMVMKSGTNHFHGSVYGHLENDELNANTWSNKHTNPVSPRPIYTQSQFGGTVGGPLIKDKLFFFAAFEAGRYHQSGTQPLSVLTAKMRMGDFSELLDPTYMCLSTDSTAACQGKLRQLYDPSNGYAPFVGNLNVPILNPVAKYLIAHPEVYPEPNATPLAGYPTTQNFEGISRTFNAYNQGDVRVDYTFRSKDRFLFHYGQAEGRDGTNFYPVPAFFQNGSLYPDKLFVFQNIHTFSSSLVNEFRAGYSRIRWEQGDPVDTSGEFGLHGDATVGICSGCSQPFQGFAGQNVTNLTASGNPAGGTNFIDNTFHYTEALTWSHGHHNSKFGVEVVRYQQNNFYPGNDGALGNFTYNGDFTSNTTAGQPGAAVADFVLDRVYMEGIGGVAGRTGQRQYRTAYYAQDDWRLTPDLTLNLGARYEFDQPIYEVNNKTANVDSATGNVIYAGSVPANNPVPGAGVCKNRACYNANYNNFMPRVGLAYSVTPKAVVRAGYGITTYLEGTGANLRLTYNPPFQPSFQVTGVAPNGTSAGTSFLVENGFSSSANPAYGGTTYRQWDQNIKPAFVSTYSFSTQYEINNKSAVTIAYVGEAGQHLIQAVAANQLHTPCDLADPGQNNAGPNSIACTAADPAPYVGLVGQSGAVVETASEGTYNYNGLQVSYRQRPISGLEYTVNYSYGKSLTTSDGFFGVPNINGPSPYAQNAYDNHSEYGPAGQDVRNSVNGTAVYRIPVGHGLRYGGNMNRALDEAVGGWSIGMTAVAYSGFPVTPYSSGFAYTNNRASRPNQYFTLPIKNRSINSWFGTDPTATACQTQLTPGSAFTHPDGTTNCAFGIAAPGTYGNARPGALRGPGYENYDMTVSKDFTVYRENKVSFRADAFNVLNHTSYNNPDSTVTDSTFGQITGVRSTERRLQLSAHYNF